MIWLIVALAVFGVSGAAAFFCQASLRWSMRVGAGGAVLGSVLGLVPALHCLLTGATATLQAPWTVPYGSWALGLDPLTAFFLLPVLILSALAAVYATEYLTADSTQAPGGHWLWFNLLSASMVLVLIARNGMLFLMAWEVMTLSSFFLVTSNHEKREVRRAGWLYLVASHVGVMFLMVLFIWLGQASGSLDFEAILAGGIPENGNWFFLLALVGFGVKAGFVPLHVWLPEAHPAAPSHVSALMSGAMIKLGIYGLLRTLLFLGTPPAGWGYWLIGIGLTSGIAGILLALGQKDLKRLLAYSSVENMGVIALGLGIGLLGLHANLTWLAVLGFGGALLHVLNHAVCKGVLFLGAGSVLHAAGSGNLDLLGGLLKRMPWTGAVYLLGATAICGLPPFNVFAGEFLIYLAAVRGSLSLETFPAVALVAVIVGLALIGGLAVAAFTKVAGIAFLGEPRTLAASRAHEAGWAMLAPMLLLVTGCGVMGILSPWLLRFLTPVIAQLVPLENTGVQSALAQAGSQLWIISACALGFWLVLGGLWFWRFRLAAGRVPAEGVTWDCGYAAPTARMQYTASSFSRPLLESFRAWVRPQYQVTHPKGIFPEQASLHTEFPDTWLHGLFAPFFRVVNWFSLRLHWLQHGRVQWYVLYIAIALIALLLWKLR